MQKPDGVRLMDEPVHKRPLQTQCNRSMRFCVRAKDTHKKPATPDWAQAFHLSNSLSTSQVSSGYYRSLKCKKASEQVTVKALWLTRPFVEVWTLRSSFLQFTIKATKATLHKRKTVSSLSGLRPNRGYLSVLAFGKGPVRS